jgi:hypothetical protein
MPHFFFDTIENTNRFHDHTGLVCASQDEACQEALSVLPIIARDRLIVGRMPQSFSVIVRDGSGEAIYSATIACTQLSVISQNQPLSNTADSAKAGPSNQTWCQIARSEAGQSDKFLPVGDCELTAPELNEACGTQIHQGPVHMHRGEARKITEFGLIEWKGERTGMSLVRFRVAYGKLAKEVR